MNVLDKIFAEKRARIAALDYKSAMQEAHAKARDAAPTRGFAAALSASKGTALIAEVKKASPSKGVLRENFDAVEIARAYHAAGAHCLSVLTDEQYFQGSAQNLIVSREAVPLPALRKDFTTDVLDVFEARAMGADAILLIVHGLGDAELADLHGAATALGMDVIVEAHSDSEADRALAAGAKLLGINNRDLTTFQTSLEVGENLLPKFAGRAFLIGESAIQSHHDVQRMAQAGAQAVLIGSAFTSAPDVGAKVKEVMGW
ncbi:MAG: indole-3-glycerol phosphate synthase TrpC [Chthonomonas sp.]|nr:indole-3-glycerol phosphate synthase TrpC [Chthonomonas sp.]